MAIPGWQVLMTGCTKDVSFPIGARGQEAEAEHRAGPIFGHPSRSESTGAGYRAEGWCDGGDESAGGDPGRFFTNAGAEAEAPGDGAMADARPSFVFVPPVCTWEERGAVRRGPIPRQVREDRLRRVENGRAALRQERDRLRVNVQDLVAETNGLKSVARSKTQEVDDLRAELAQPRGEPPPQS
jgi:hypothetical protein